MKTNNSFKDLVVWQKSVKLVKVIYQLTSKLPKSEIYGISNQMRRAAISIPSNIAEGQQRKNLKEFLQFLRVSYGSAGELETQLIISQEIYPSTDFSESSNLLNEVQRMLISMIKKFEAKF